MRYEEKDPAIRRDNEAYAEQLELRSRVRGKPEVKSWSTIVTFEWWDKEGHPHSEYLYYAEKDFKVKIDKLLEQTGWDGQ